MGRAYNTIHIRMPRHPKTALQPTEQYEPKRRTTNKSKTPRPTRILRVSRWRGKATPTLTSQETWQGKVLQKRLLVDSHRPAVQVAQVLEGLLDHLDLTFVDCDNKTRTRRGRTNVNQRQRGARQRIYAGATPPRTKKKSACTNAELAPTRQPKRRETRGQGWAEAALHLSAHRTSLGQDHPPL